MGKKPEDQIEEKLRELELAMKEEQEKSNLPAADSKTSSLAEASRAPAQKLSKADEPEAVKADLHMLGGFATILLGVLILFSNLRVTMGWGIPGLAWLGGAGGSQGFFVLLLIVGVGFFFYDYKNKAGWLLITGSVIALIFGIFSSLHMYFSSMSLLGFIFMFIPIALGSAFVAKGLKMHKEIEDKKGKS